jgi:hypothetical protein
MRMSVPALGLLALALTPFFACSSTTPTTGGGNPPPGGTGNPPPNPTSTGPQGTPAPTPMGHDANPYGAAYPAANVGYAARMGNVAGNQIKNYKFIGYPNADTSKGLQTVALADYFDPQGKTQIPGGATGIKIIHLGVAAVWCVPCNDETDAIVPLVASLAQKGVVFVQALDDGPIQGTGATTGDLNGWVSRHRSNFTEMLDPANANLGQFFDAAAIPWNAEIDARTMEILQAGVGYSGDVAGDIQPYLDWVNHNPPSY